MSNEPQDDLESEVIHDLTPDITIDLSDLAGFPASPVSQDATDATNGGADLAIAPEVSARNLNVLRRAVRRFWVVGGLCSSLHNELMLRLDIQEERRVMYPSLWTMIYQQAEQDDRTFDDTDSLLDAFNQSEQQMVILGTDGAGKTMTLLQIAEELSEPNDDDLQFVPVVFNLAAWNPRFLPLSDWLTHELVETYQMPKGIAQSWVLNNELVVLLDGLDEVAGEHSIRVCRRSMRFVKRIRLVLLLPVGAVCTRRLTHRSISTARCASNHIRPIRL